MQIITATKIETPSTQNKSFSFYEEKYSTIIDITAATISTISISSQIAYLKIRNNDFLFLFLYSFKPYLSPFYFTCASVSPPSTVDLNTTILNCLYFLPYLWENMQIEFINPSPQFPQIHGCASQYTFK